MVSSVTSNNSIPNDRLRNVAAVTAGTAVGLATPAYMLYDAIKPMTALSAKEDGNFLSSLLPDCDSFERTKETAEKIMKDTGLKDKGVSLMFIDKSDAQSTKQFKDFINESKPTSAFSKRLCENCYQTFKEGGNSAFIRSGKKEAVILNKDRLFTTAYHEIGHALDAHSKNIFTKILFKSRALTPLGISVVAPVALMTAILHKNDKTKPKENKNFVEKTLDFISDHATEITAASYLPMLSEEALASIKGIRQAKKHLPSDTVWKLGGNYAKAWGTYGVAAGLVIAGVWAGSKLADYIRNNNQSKESNNFKTNIA